MLDYLDSEFSNEDVNKLAPSASELRRQQYKAAQGDSVDEAMANLLNMHGFNLPVIRMRTGMYLIGTDSRLVMIKNESCVVRVGGGFESLESYIEAHEAAELNKLKRLMEEGNKTFADVIKDLLNKYKADQAVVNQFMKTI